MIGELFTYEHVQLENIPWSSNRDKKQNENKKNLYWFWHLFLLMKYESNICTAIIKVHENQVMLSVDV